jgi:hypothetical protein
MSSKKRRARRNARRRAEKPQSLPPHKSRHIGPPPLAGVLVALFAVDFAVVTSPRLRTG